LRLVVLRLLRWRRHGNGIIVGDGVRNPDKAAKAARGTGEATAAAEAAAAEATAATKAAAAEAAAAKAAAACQANTGTAAGQSASG
jgi:hypothetical protein